MLAIRAYLLVDFQVNAEATPDSFLPAHGTRPVLSLYRDCGALTEKRAPDLNDAERGAVKTASFCQFCAPAAVNQPSGHHRPSLTTAGLAATPIHVAVGNPRRGW